MKRTFWITPFAALALAGTGTAGAAEISNISGQSCGELTGTWHFVNNQTGLDAPQGTITATWDSGDSCEVAAYKVLRRVQHFSCTATGALTSASTNLPGRLVLSDFSCATKPPCDPKVEQCEEPPPPPPPCDPKVEQCE